jgi:hypothetical protein
MAATDDVKPPLCSGCGNPMLVAFTVPDKPGRERRIFKCPTCGKIETVVKQIAVAS